MLHRRSPRLLLAALLLWCWAGPGQGAVQLGVRGRTALGEVIDSQGMWRGRPLALFFWSVADPSSLRLMKQAAPALERAGYRPLGVHPDHNAARVQEALRTGLPGWDSLPDTGFALAGKAGLGQLPGLAVYQPGGGFRAVSGERAVRQWLAGLGKSAGASPRAPATVSLALSQQDTPLLLASFAALLLSHRGVELYAVKANHRRLALAGQPVKTLADTPNGRVLALLKDGQLWALNLRGEKTLLAQGLAQFCVRPGDGLAGLVRRDGAVATVAPGKPVGKFNTRAGATACGFAADGGALVLVKPLR